MPKRIKKPTPRKVVLRLPDLDHKKTAVLSSSSSLDPGETKSLRWTNSSLGTARPETRPESNGGSARDRYGKQACCR
jgi:hypothetical protein